MARKYDVQIVSWEDGEATEFYNVALADDCLECQSVAFAHNPTGERRIDALKLLGAAADRVIAHLGDERPVEPPKDTEMYQRCLGWTQKARHDIQSGLIFAVKAFYAKAAIRKSEESLEAAYIAGVGAKRQHVQRPDGSVDWEADDDMIKRGVDPEATPANK